MVDRIVHRLWLGGEEPEWTRGFAETWRRPGWVLHEWTDSNIGALFPLQNQELYDRASTIAKGSEGQFRADILRYEILLRYGGVYVDADLECLRPIDPLVYGVSCFAAWESQGRWVNNAIMGAIPRHEFIQLLVDGLPKNVHDHRGSRPNKLSGPQYVTNLRRIHPELSVRVYDKQLFYPYLWNELTRSEETFDGAFAVHHWANQRKRRGIPYRPRGTGTA